MQEFLFPAPSATYFTGLADSVEAEVLALKKSGKTDEAVRAENRMNGFLVRAFGADQARSSFCRDAVSRMYRHGRIDLMGEWMQRVVWTRDRDFRFIHAWLSNVNPNIAGEAVTALGKSGDPAISEEFARRLVDSESLPMRLRLIKALGELGLPGTMDSVLSACDSRLQNRNYLPFAEEMAIITTMGRIGEKLENPHRVGRLLADRWDTLGTRKLQSEELLSLRTNILYALSRAGQEETGRIYRSILDQNAPGPVLDAVIRSAGRTRIEVARDVLPRALTMELTEDVEHDCIEKAAEFSGLGDGRELLFPTEWLVKRLERNRDRSAILKILAGHPPVFSKKVFLDILKSDRAITLREADVIARHLREGVVRDSAGLLAGKIRANPEDELVPLWMQVLASLRVPETRMILVDLSRDGLPGIRILAEQILDSWKP